MQACESALLFAFINLDSTTMVVPNQSAYPITCRDWQELPVVQEHGEVESVAG